MTPAACYHSVRPPKTLSLLVFFILLSSLLVSCRPAFAASLSNDFSPLSYHSHIILSVLCLFPLPPFPSPFHSLVDLFVRFFLLLLYSFPLSAFQCPVHRILIWFEVPTLLLIVAVNTHILTVFMVFLSFVRLLLNFHTNSTFLIQNIFIRKQMHKWKW